MGLPTLDNDPQWSWFPSYSGASVKGASSDKEWLSGGLLQAWLSKNI